MRILIAEDDMTSRKFLFKFLSRYGECDLVVDGLEAVDAYLLSVKQSNPYDLICLDIMMPKIDGITVLKSIRDMEQQRNVPETEKVKVIMTTALAETNLVGQAFETGCDAYAAKPLDTNRITDVMKKFGLI